MAVFDFRHDVLFQHCDPAGIVFYPRYFEMINACVEVWFRDALHSSFADIHVTEGAAVPAVSISTQFSAPSRLGDVLDFALSVTRVGRTSCDLDLTVSCGAEIRLRCTMTIVHVDMKTGRPVAWPEHLKTPMLQYLHES